MLDCEDLLRVIGQSIQAHRAAPPVRVAWRHGGDHVLVSGGSGMWELSAADLARLDAEGRARRGRDTAGDHTVEDTLRVVGAALVQLGADTLDLVLDDNLLLVQFTVPDDPSQPVEVIYDAEELAELRHLAVSRRSEATAFLVAGMTRSRSARD